MELTEVFADSCTYIFIKSPVQSFTLYLTETEQYSFLIQCYY